jgi:hypothetical protein
MRLAILAAVASLMFAGPALANGCPGLMAKVDDALAKNPSLTAEQLAEVQQLRADGEAQHTSGQHAQSMESLGKALEILGVQ